MGLDMYLRAEKYVSGYEFRGEEAVADFKRLVEQLGAEGIVDPDTPSATVSFTCAYWRKANQIHSWFVQNVQDGEDECKPYAVSREQLMELRDLCKEILGFPTVEEPVTVGIGADGQVMKDKTQRGAAIHPDFIDKAAELLPTASGFFFGGTEYDHWYRQDLESTVEQIQRVLDATDGENEDAWWLEYQSSW